MAEPAVGDEELAVIGEYLCEQSGSCTCDPGPLGEHRQGCGFVPVYSAEKVREVLARRRVYRVGELDDTEGTTGFVDVCDATCDEWACTRLAGHGGNHAAGDSTTVAAVWPIGGV
jgi:hypothetical protein